MSLEQQIANGEVYRESGFSDPEDIALAKKLAHQRQMGKHRSFAYNQTDPVDEPARQKILRELFGSVGKDVFIEGPVYTSYGNHTHIGDHFYANFNFTVVDDAPVTIGNYVMCGPNVMISVTGHPLKGPKRRHGDQFSKPVVIGDDVWIGGNVAILPGVHVGSNVVIGVGSVVTHDVPDDSVVVGVPARIVKQLPPRMDHV